MSWSCVLWQKIDVPLRPGERLFQLCALLGLREGDRRCLKGIHRQLLGARANVARSGQE